MSSDSSTPTACSEELGLAVGVKVAPEGKPEEAAALTRVRQALETDRYAALKAADQLVIATERQKGAGTKLSYIFPSEVWLPFTARRGGMLLRSSPGCRSPVCCLGERSFSDRPLA